MNIETILTLIGKLGFPIVVALWFLFKIQNYLELQAASNATIIEVLRQLVALHNK